MAGVRIPRALVGIRARVATLVLLAVLPTAALTLIDARADGNRAAAAARTELHRVAELAAVQQQQLVDQTRSVLIALSHAPALQPGNWSRCSEYLAAALPDYPLYDNLGVTDTTGIIRCSAVASDRVVDVSDRSYFSDALSMGNFSSGTYQIGRITGTTSVNFGYPVYDRNGRAVGVVFAALDVGWLNRFVAGLELPDDAAITVFDVNGIVIARYPHPRRFVGEDDGQTALFRAVRSSGGRIEEVEGADGVDRMYAFETLKGTVAPTAYIAIGLPTRTLYAEATASLHRHVVVLVLVALLVLAVGAIAASTMLVRPLGRLTAAADRLREGDLDARVPAGGDGELATLGRSFNAMADALLMRTTQLGETVRRLHNLLEIDRAMLSATSSEDIAHGALEALRAVVDYDRAAVLMFDREARTLTVLTAVEDEELGTPPGTVIAFHDLADHEQLEGDEVMFADEFTLDGAPSPVMGHLRDRGIVSAVTIPLRSNEGVMGRLLLSSKRRSFPPEQIATALEIADQLGIALSAVRMRDGLAALATELEARLEDLRRGEAHRRWLLGKLVHAQEEERRAIAEDIHDDSVQAMVAAALRLSTMRIRVDDRDLRASLESIEESVSSAIGRLRNLLFELSPQFLERDGVVVAVRRYAEEAFADLDIAVSVEDHLNSEPTYEGQVVAYRTMQAALGNVRAHARASHVRIELTDAEGGVLGRVVDDGVGFDPAEQRPRPGHLGIEAMRERVEMAGGWLRIASRIEHGTTVEFFVPTSWAPAAQAERARVAAVR
jgi:signal transduction histidine kinase